MNKIAVVLLALVLTACASGSGRIDWDKVRTLQVGMTEKEVVKRVGDPFHVTGKSDGTEIWSWATVSRLTGSTANFSVIMKDGKAIDVPKVPDSM